MFSHTLLKVGVDIAFVLVVVATAVLWVRSGLPVNVTALLVYSALLAILMIVINTWLGLYKSQQSRTIYQDIARALLTLYLSVPLAYIIFSFLPFAEADRSFFELTVMTAMYGMLANRIRSIHSPLPGWMINRVLILGVGERAKFVYETLLKSDPTALVVGFFPVQSGEEVAVPADKILSKDLPLTDMALSLNADEIVVAVVEQRGGAMPLKELLDCKLIGVQVLDLASHFEQRLGQIRLDSLRAGWLVFGDGFEQGSLRTATKRIFDFLCASLLLLLSLPVMVVTAILILIESGFPIFYRQERVGLNGRVFEVVKFRSMRTDAEKDGKPRWASSGDPRITTIGRIIRKMRIDELPQLLCVLQGDMSLVGPRPERPYFVDQLTREIPFYAVRHSVKPGVTGWAQVCYHYGASIDDSAEKLQYDLYYVKNHTLFLDMVVLFKTVGVVISAKGA
jgi:sugar transferase (PEP-CTERM system associated)